MQTYADKSVENNKPDIAQKYNFICKRRIIQDMQGFKKINQALEKEISNMMLTYR